MPAVCLSWNKSEEYSYCLHGPSLISLWAVRGLDRIFWTPPVASGKEEQCPGTSDTLSVKSHSLKVFGIQKRKIKDRVLRVLRTPNLTFAVPFTFPTTLQARKNSYYLGLFKMEQQSHAPISTVSVRLKIRQCLEALKHGWVIISPTPAVP